MSKYHFFVFIFFSLLVYLIYLFDKTGDLIVQIVDILPIPKFIKDLLNILLKQKKQKNSKVHRHVTPLTKKIVASNQKWRCAHCNQLLDFTYEIDHIVPLFKGGSNSQSNLQALCRICHGRKTLSGY